jgi:hypothetical protein
MRKDDLYRQRIHNTEGLAVAGLEKGGLFVFTKTIVFALRKADLFAFRKADCFALIKAGWFVFRKTVFSP